MSGSQLNWQTFSGVSVAHSGWYFCRVVYFEHRHVSRSSSGQAMGEYSTSPVSSSSVLYTQQRAQPSQSDSHYCLVISCMVLFCQKYALVSLLMVCFIYWAGCYWQEKSHFTVSRSALRLVAA